MDFFLAFGIIISLWWWYAMVLPNAHASVHFGQFTLDFAALATIAFASRFWNRSEGFFFLAIIGSLLVGGRCGWAWAALSPELEETYGSPLFTIALIAGIIAILGIGIFIGVAATRASDFRNAIEVFLGEDFLGKK